MSAHALLLSGDGALTLSLGLVAAVITAVVVIGESRYRRAQLLADLHHARQMILLGALEQAAAAAERARAVRARLWWDPPMSPEDVGILEFGPLAVLEPHQLVDLR